GMEYPSSVSAAILQSLPKDLQVEAQKAVPREARTFINQKSFFIVETEVVSLAGSTISKMEYRGIERPSSLRDDLFLPPDGLELLKPQSLKDYTAILMSRIMPRPDKPASSSKPNLAKATVPVSSPRQKAEINPRTGRIIP